MTITVQTPRSGPYTGNGSTTAFAYGFLIDDEAELIVTLATAAGVETVQTITTHYTVSGVGANGGGTVTFLTAPATGEKVAIRRATALEQTLDLQNRGAVVPQSLEDAYDNLLKIVQDLQEKVDRTLQTQITAPVFTNPAVVALPDGYLKINSAGDGFEADSAINAVTAASDLAITGNWTFTAPTTTFTGTVTADGVAVGDNETIALGTGNDLIIRHTGTASQINNQTGALSLNTDTSFWVRNFGGTEQMALFSVNGGVDLYYDNALKFSTTNAGATVTGDLTVTGSIGGFTIAPGAISLANTETLTIGDVRGFEFENNSNGAGSYKATMLFPTSLAADFFDIQTDGQVRFLSKDGLSSFFTISSGAVTLYASGAPVVTAVSGQVNITGDAQVQGNVKGTFDNTYDLGTPSVRWDDVYATNGTIQTSDATEKDDIAALTAAEKRVGQACMGLFKKFRWKSAKAEKGEAARTHLGIMAQEVEAIFVAEGLDPFAYGVLAKGPTFDDVVEDVVDENGNVNKRPVMAVNGKVKTTPRLDADGNQKTLYGIRKDELYAMIFASMAP